MEIVCKPDQIESHLDSDHRTFILDWEGEWQEIQRYDDGFSDWDFERDGLNHYRHVYYMNGECESFYSDENVTLRKVRKDASDDQQ